MQATAGMHHVYIIRSLCCPQERYIGQTQDLDGRLQQHNQGRSPHTSKQRPWQFETVVSFHDKSRALAFEHYLKTGSGFAFA